MLAGVNGPSLTMTSTSIASGRRTGTLPSSRGRLAVTPAARTFLDQCSTLIDGPRPASGAGKAALTSRGG